MATISIIGQKNDVDGRNSMRQGVDEELLIEKEETIQELRETVEILELKVKKLEQLVRLKSIIISALHANNITDEIIAGRSTAYTILLKY